MADLELPSRERSELPASILHRISAWQSGGAPIRSAPLLIASKVS